MKTKQFAQDIILEPMISEKTVIDKENNKYVFKVHVKANKVEIGQAVEELFKVKVAKVNTMNYDGKKKRMGQFVGRTSKFKKAIVTLKPGESIAFFEGI
jgi:large subunit ribosomal protein L23